MITGISIENFKGIGERVDFELAPITLLFGPNSSGKSTLIHALHYAREIFERCNLNADQTTSGGKFIDLGRFAAIVHQHDLNCPIIRLGLTLDLKGSTTQSTKNTEKSARTTARRDVGSATFSVVFVP